MVNAIEFLIRYSIEFDKLHEIFLKLFQKFLLEHILLALYTAIQPREHWLFFAHDFLKSSTKCGGYPGTILLIRQKIFN